VGQIAKRRRSPNPQNTVFRRQAADRPQVSRSPGGTGAPSPPYTLAEAINGDMKIEIRDRQYSPEEISALILREIKEFVEEGLRRKCGGGDHRSRPTSNDSSARPPRTPARSPVSTFVRNPDEPTAASPGLRPRPPGRDQHHRRLRPRRRHLRHLDPPASRRESSRLRSTAGDTYLGGEDSTSGSWTG